MIKFITNCSCRCQGYVQGGRYVVAGRAGWGILVQMDRFPVARRQGCRNYGVRIFAAIRPNAWTGFRSLRRVFRGDLRHAAIGGSNVLYPHTTSLSAVHIWCYKCFTIHNFLGKFQWIQKNILFKTCSWYI